MSLFQNLFGKKGSQAPDTKGKTCSSCGASNHLDVKFCSSCGSEFHLVSDSFDAFISYRRETGSELASLLKIQLENRFNKSIFLDVNELQVGRFDEELLNRIEKTPNFIVILSKASLDRCANKSDWLKRELMQALKTGSNIIPVITEGFAFPSDELWALLPSEMRVLPSLNGVNYSHIHQDSAIRKIASYMKSESKDYKQIAKPDTKNKFPGDIEGDSRILIKEDMNKISLNPQFPDQGLLNTPIKNSKSPEIKSNYPPDIAEISKIHEAFRLSLGGKTQPASANIGKATPGGPAKPQINFITKIPDKQEVSGTWEAKDSPVFIEGEAIVPKGKILTIMPGVTVHFRTGSNTDYIKPNFDRGFLRVNGKLIACGTEQISINFKGDDPDKWKSWGTIIIHSDDPGTKFSYCTFEQSYCVQNAISVSGIGKYTQMSFWGALSLYKSDAIIENCIFVNNTYAAISCDRSSPVIVGTTIINDGNHPSSSFSAISCRDSSCPRILYCTIVCKKGRGVLSYSSMPIIENSIIVVENSGQPKNYPQTRTLSAYSLLKVKDSDEIYIDNGGNVLEQDPQFVNRECGDFHLRTNSPCINAGSRKNDLGAFPLNLRVDLIVPDKIEFDKLSTMISQYSVYPARGIIELNNGEEVTLGKFFIRDHGAQVNSLMLSETFDMNSIVSIKDILNIQRVSGEEVEIKLKGGGKKSWKICGR
jgi:hypothetical protein